MLHVYTNLTFSQHTNLKTNFLRSMYVVVLRTSSLRGIISALFHDLRRTRDYPSSLTHLANDYTHIEAPAVNLQRALVFTIKRYFHARLVSRFSFKERERGKRKNHGEMIYHCRVREVKFTLITDNRNVTDGETGDRSREDAYVVIQK